MIADVRDLQSEFTKLRSEITSLQDTNSKLQSDIAETDTAIQKNCASINRKDTEIEAKSRALEEKDATISAMSEQLTKTREYLTTKEQVSSIMNDTVMHAPTRLCVCVWRGNHCIYFTPNYPMQVYIYVVSHGQSIS